MKKIISIALALLMVAVMLPVMAMAADDTALPTADANGVIKLENNVTLSSFAKIEGNMKLDLNGHTITCTNNWAIVVAQYGKLTVVDSSPAGTGAIVCTGGQETARTAIFGGDYTGIIIEGGHIKGVDYGVVLMGKSSSLTVNGGVIEGGDAAISGNGSLDETTKQPLYGDTQIKINGGKVIGGNTGIYQPQDGDLTIYNGEITGKTGIEVRAGRLAVIGGAITATGTTLTVNKNGSGGTTEGAAIAIAQHTTKLGIAVTIEGGTLTGVAALNEANPENNPNDYTGNISVNVSGGTFNGAVNKAEDGSYLGVMGGTFKTNVTPYVGETLVVENNGTYFVGGTAIDAVQDATGGTFTVVAVPDEPVKFENVKPGVTVKNGTAETVTVNGNNVPRNESYTVPGTITIIVPSDGGNTTTTPSTDNTKNPSTGANDFVGVAAAMAVVSLLGAAAVIRKK